MPWSPSKSQPAEGRAGYHGQEGRPPEARGQILQSQLGPGRAPFSICTGSLGRSAGSYTSIHSCAHTQHLCFYDTRSRLVINTIHLANTLSLLNDPHGNEASEMLPGAHPLFIPKVMEHLRRILCCPPPLSLSRDSATEAEWVEGWGGGGLPFDYSPHFPLQANRLAKKQGNGS